MTTAWTPQDVVRSATTALPAIPRIDAVERSGLEAGRLYWDMWPVQDAGGRIAQIAGRELWMALTAPDRGDPGLRHFEAKIHLLERAGKAWRDLGPVLPDRAVPFEREWAGSAWSDGNSVWLHFTGAGDATRPGGFQQALYEAHAVLGSDGLPADWSAPVPSILAPSPLYQPADAHDGEPGRIKAFRDPAWFRDPADGAEYLIFTASLAASASDFNGAVGIARKSPAGWELLPPLIHADGVNNELERAHIVCHAGRYHVFWATQRSTFSPELRHAPNGLYGMVADSLFGPYRPLNGSGLVLANPADAPTQTYSWFVSADLAVSSFVDAWGPDGSAFGGVPAPLLRLRIEGDTCRLSESITA